MFWKFNLLTSHIDTLLDKEVSFVRVKVFCSVLTLGKRIFQSGVILETQEILNHSEKVKLENSHLSKILVKTAVSNDRKKTGRVGEIAGEK